MRRAAPFVADGGSMEDVVEALAARCEALLAGGAGDRCVVGIAGTGGVGWRRSRNVEGAACCAKTLRHISRASFRGLASLSHFLGFVVILLDEITL